MKENQKFKKLGNVSFRRHLNKKSAKITVRLDIPLKLVYEKYEIWKNGNKMQNKEIGEMPDCCHSLPRKNAIYLCKCKKHILRIDGVKNHKISKSVLIQIAEISERISHQHLCKHLCK